MQLLKFRQELMSGKSIYDLPLRVTFYARVSSEKENQINSLENQVFYYKNKIKNVEKWTFVDGYIDEGISGTSTLKREEFLNMIDDANKNKFDLIITKEISRFARDTLDSIKYTRELLEREIGVYFETDNINTILPDSELRLAIMASIAQDEVRKLSERVRFGLKRSIEKERVLGNSNIRGYIKDNGKLVIDEEQAETVRLLFELYASEKYGFEKIADILYEKGHRTSNNKRISATNLKRILTNPKYKGYYCSNRVAKPDYRSRKQIKNPKEDWIVHKCSDESIVPAIVTQELWDKANKIYYDRSKAWNKQNPDKSKLSNRYSFSGKIICKEHNRYFVRSAGPKRKCRPVWICGIYDLYGIKKCQSPIILEEELYIIMKNVFSKFLINKDKIIEKMLKRYKNDNVIEKINKERILLDKKICSIMNKKDKLLELNLEGTITKEEFKEMNKKLNFDLDEINEKITKIEMKKEDMKNFDSYLAKLRESITKELDLSSKENIDLLIKLLIDKIVVSKIDEDRKNIKLEVLFKFGDKREIRNRLGFSKSKKNTSKKCHLPSYNKSDEFAFDYGTN